MEENVENQASQSFRSSFIYEWIGSVMGALIFVIFIFTFVAHQFEVFNVSMNPTLYEGDRVFVFSLLYEPKQGDVVVLSTKDYEDGKPLIKRVIALGGQTIDIDFDTGEVTVDGEVLDEPYIAELTHRMGDVTFPLTVPDGYVFVMGDNRNQSSDSRVSNIGNIDEREIVGRAVAIMYPFDHIKVL